MDQSTLLRQPELANGYHTLNPLGHCPTAPSIPFILTFSFQFSFIGICKPFLYVPFLSLFISRLRRYRCPNEAWMSS